MHLTGAARNGDISFCLPEIDLVTKFATNSYVISHADHGDPRPSRRLPYISHRNTLPPHNKR